jgi:hypothetical protein
MVAGTGRTLGRQRAARKTERGFSPWPQETKKNVFFFYKLFTNFKLF